MSKIITRVLSVLLIVVMAFPNVAFASDQGNGQTEQYSEVISIQASETVGPDTKYPESLSKAPNYSDFSTKLEIIDYIQNGPKSFFAGCDTITADELLAKSQYVFTTKAGGCNWDVHVGAFRYRNPRCNMGLYSKLYNHAYAKWNWLVFQKCQLYS